MNRRAASRLGMIDGQSYWRILLWPQLAALAALVAGLRSARGRLSFRPATWPELGRVLYAVALATFGAEHWASAKEIMQLVPEWIPPGQAFWTYFFGVAQLLAALALILEKRVALAAALLGVMFLLFVGTLSIPGLVEGPGDRFSWALTGRDTFFGLAAWALASKELAARQIATPRWVQALVRFVAGAILLFYGVEHFLHPLFTPGVPLKRQSAAWVPLRSLSSYVVGALLIFTGGSFVLGRGMRRAATLLGAALTLIAVLSLPMFALARSVQEMTEAINHVCDTLLFAGSVLLFAGAAPPAPSTARGELSAAP